MKINKKNIRYISIITIGWIAFITVISLLPSSDIPKVSAFKNIQIDKIVHIFMYFTLIVLLLSTHQYYGWKVQKIYLIVIALCFGILIEFLQNLMKLGRDFDYYDILANFIGLLIGFIVYEKLIKSSSLWITD